MKVTQHAIHRWRERTGSKHPDDKIRVKILDLVATGEEVVIKKRFRLLALLDHGCDEAKYMKATNGMILVVANGAVVTIHNGKADRWERKGE